MDTRLGEFEQLLLFALLRLGDDAYGVTLRREIETRTSRVVSAGAVYTAMERLETRGFVSSTIGEPTPRRGGKRKKYYRLEQVGARALTRSYDSLHKMASGVLPKLARAASDNPGT
jgi:PadR family transcriptional regulator, regulatory protein PadR